VTPLSLIKNFKGKGDFMTNELTKTASSIMSVEITREDIKNVLCPFATEKEIFMALGIINSLNLNPFLKEVHLIKYDQKSPISIVVGYEVYIKRAERTKQLDGWHVNIIDNEAVLTIHRKDWKEPFIWAVNLNEFSKNQATWKQIPTFMGKKVAIAQGFRLCFPDELGGMPYTKEEHEVYDITPKPQENNIKKPQPIASQPTKPQPTNRPQPKKEAPIILTISEALKASTGANITIQGTLTNVDEREVSAGKYMTDYSICENPNNIVAGSWMKIQKWGKIITELQLGDLIESNIIVSEFKGKKQYQAQTIIKK
jgi:phage recombination protein Bet